MSNFFKLVYYDFFIDNQLVPFWVTVISFGLIFIFTTIFVIIEVKKVRGVK